MPSSPTSHRFADRCFVASLVVVGGSYIVLIVALLAADVAYTTPYHLAESLRSPEIQASIRLTFLSCTITAILSVYVAVPLGYLLSRYRFPGHRLIDTIVDIPLVLPPFVVGLSLLILFHQIGNPSLEKLLNQTIGVEVTYAVPAVILAQFTVACGFAVRTLRLAFDQIPQRTESVALTLGASRWQAFSRIVLPQAWRGIVTAAISAWARAFGEFGPVLVFAGALRWVPGASGSGRSATEVLSTTVYLEWSSDKLETAVAVSLFMVLVAVAVLLLVRFAGLAPGESEAAR